MVTKLPMVIVANYYVPTRVIWKYNFTGDITEDEICITDHSCPIA